MKIIFLDIDGVLNSTRSAEAYSAQYGGNGYGGYFGEDEEPRHENVLFDPEGVRWLREILDCY